MRHAEQRIAHRAADDARFLTVAVEHRKKFASGRSLSQGDPLDVGSLHHPRNELAVLDMRRHVSESFGSPAQCASTR